MKTRPKLAGVAASALTLTALVGGIAYANGSHASSPATATTATTATEVVNGPDLDSVQEGDQTSADTGTAAESASQQAAEKAAESAGETESADVSDGPGGHQDPPGDVHHEGGASEQ